MSDPPHLCAWVPAVPARSLCLLWTRCSVACRRAPWRQQTSRPACCTAVCARAAARPSTCSCALPGRHACPILCCGRWGGACCAVAGGAGVWCCGRWGGRWGVCVVLWLVGGACCAVAGGGACCAVAGGGGGRVRHVVGQCVRRLNAARNGGGGTVLAGAVLYYNVLHCTCWHCTVLTGVALVVR